MKLKLLDIARWSSARIEHSGVQVSEATGYSIDSRTIEPGDLFFAVRGERFDGHDFVAAAIERGACAAVVSEEKAALFADLGGALLLVQDPLQALQQLAAAVRRSWGHTVVAVTGSAGKTTTKDAIAAVLGRRFHVLKSEGNLNNGFGLPLQLLKLQPEHEIAVLEMGMSHAGEIALLSRIASPEWGVVTNVGHAHAENFPDGQAGVARAKYELVEALPASGVAFLNCDDSYVSQFGRDFHGQAVYYGTGPCADPRAERIKETSEGSRFDVHAGEEQTTVDLHLLGKHNVQNSLAAIAVGLHAGIPLESCRQALAELKPTANRGEVLMLHGATIIDDCYNSNPEALLSMIHTLAAMPGNRKILVAGEMLELGSNAAVLHRRCGEKAAREGIDLVLGVRGNAEHIVSGASQGGVRAHFVESPQEAGEWLKAELRPGDVVLMKASRGVRLEQALGMLKEAS
jgi:UDP-N-acetylmuramoyl-tripeptide--D-alanyl-D-alanine ligase